MTNNTLEGPPSLQPQIPETYVQRSLRERIGDKIGSARAWVHDQLSPSSPAELEQETGSALTFVAERTIAEVDSRGPRDTEGEELVVEAVGAAAEQTIDGGLAGKPKNPIEVLEDDGHDKELVDATVAIAAEDTTLAEQIAREIDRVEAADDHPRVAEKEVYDAKKKVLRDTKKSSAEVFTSGSTEGLSKTERKAFFDRPENWDEERRDLHEVVYEDAIEDAEALSARLLEANPKPTIYALRGNTASGKTRALSAGYEMFSGILDDSGEPSGAINPDTYKHSLKEGDAEVSAFQVHDEGSMISRRVERTLRRGDMSIVFDKRNEVPGDITDILANAEETSRAVRILDVDVPFETSLVGVLMRPKGGEDPNVPFDAIAEGFAGIRGHRHDLIQQIEDNAEIVDGYMFMAFDPAERRSVVVAQLVDGEVRVDPRRQALYDEARASQEAAAVEAEAIGNTMIDDAFIEQYCANYFEGAVEDNPYATKVAQRLAEFKGMTLKRAVDVMAGSDPPETSLKVDPNSK